MLEKRSTIDSCAADLEMARKIFNHLASERGPSDEQVIKAAVHAKKLEVKLAAAKLAHAEYYLSSIIARLDYLEARCTSPDGAVRREREELDWIRGALPINTATVTRLTDEIEQRKRELESLLSRAPVTEAVA